jgi:hypothetical protein
MFIDMCKPNASQKNLILFLVCFSVRYACNVAGLPCPTELDNPHTSLMYSCNVGFISPFSVYPININESAVSCRHNTANKTASPVPHDQLNYLRYLRVLRNAQLWYVLLNLVASLLRYDNEYPGTKGFEERTASIFRVEGSNMHSYCCGNFKCH